MKSLKILFMLAMLMALVTTLSATSGDEEQSPDDEKDYFETSENYNDFSLHENEEPTSLRGTSRLLAQASRARVTCNKYPRLCRATWSPGPDCCKKKCVDVMIDRLNCGMCGKKCKYSEICCKGECVNPRSNRKHCGSCNNKCKKWSWCVYGMCSYA